MPIYDVHLQLCARQGKLALAPGAQDGTGKAGTHCVTATRPSTGPARPAWPASWGAHGSEHGGPAVPATRVLYGHGGTCRGRARQLKAGGELGGSAWLPVSNRGGEGPQVQELAGETAGVWDLGEAQPCPPLLTEHLDVWALLQAPESQQQIDLGPTSSPTLSGAYSAPGPLWHCQAEKHRGQTDSEG